MFAHGTLIYDDLSREMRCNVSQDHHINITLCVACVCVLKTRWMVWTTLMLKLFFYIIKYKVLRFFLSFSIEYLD